MRHAEKAAAKGKAAKEASMTKTTFEIENTATDAAQIYSQILISKVYQKNRGLQTTVSARIHPS